MPESKMILNYGGGECFAEAGRKEGCKILSRQSAYCRTYKCPFYKPRGCKDWIRRQDGKQVSIIPPEEYYAKNQKITKDGEHPTWKIVRRRITAPSAEQLSKAASIGDQSAESTKDVCVPLAVMAASTM